MSTALLDYGNTPLGQLAVVGSLIVSLVVGVSLIRLLWRRGKKVSDR